MNRTRISVDVSSELHDRIRLIAYKTKRTIKSIVIELLEGRAREEKDIWQK